MRRGLSADSGRELTAALAAVAWPDLRPYDWTPTAARSATTDPNLVARPRRSESASDDITVSAAVDEFVEAAESGRAVNRSGRPYRPSALRDLRGILEYHVVRNLGNARLRDVRRSDVQTLVDRLGADRLSESRIRSVVSALRALYGYAIERGHVEFNPADGLVMPPGDEHVRGGVDELWDDLPAWEDRPPPRPVRQGDPHVPRERDPSWRGQREASGHDRREPSCPGQRERVEYEPIAPLPQRMLSFAVRAVVVLFALVALVSLLESL